MARSLVAVALLVLGAVTLIALMFPGQGVLTGVVKHKQVKIEGDGLVTGKFARRGGRSDGRAVVAGR